MSPSTQACKQPFSRAAYFQTETYQSTVLLWFRPFAANTDCVGKNPHFRPNLSFNLFFEVEVATEHKAIGPLKSNGVPCGAAHSCREGPTVGATFLWPHVVFSVKTHCGLSCVFPLGFLSSLLCCFYHFAVLLFPFMIVL